MNLGWTNEELSSNTWIRIANQPRVGLMMVAKDEESATPEREKLLIYCAQSVPKGRQQELAELSYQMRSRMLE